MEPLAAPPLDGWLESLEAALLELGAEELGAVLTEPLALVEPPAAESFFVASDDEAALEEEPASFLVVSTLAEPDTELEPEPDGAVAEPDGAGVVVAPEDDVADEPARRSPALSPQAASKLAPKTIDTATAKVESLMCWASVVGVNSSEQGLGPCR